MRTLLPRGAGGEGNATIQFGPPWPRGVLSFVLHLPRENRWLKNGSGDFAIALPAGPGAPPSPQRVAGPPAAGDRAAGLCAG